MQPIPQDFCETFNIQGPLLIYVHVSVICTHVGFPNISFKNFESFWKHVNLLLEV